jgi:ABC-type nitrate/sulfonate/bicarbonate transport system substrate-binding protein
VRLRDTTFTPDEALPDRAYFQVACGAAALGWRAGHPWKIVFVAVDRPMFWVYGTADDLAGATIAGYPAGSPPDVFLREALAGDDVEIVPCGTDAVRLGLVRSGSVAAAVLSSAVSPPPDLRPLLFGGDSVRAATTGIAVHERALTEEGGLVAALVRAHRRALAAIHARSVDVSTTVAEVFALAPSRLAELQPCFTPDGRTDASRDPELFDFSLLDQV